MFFITACILLYILKIRFPAGNSISRLLQMKYGLYIFIYILVYLYDPIVSHLLYSSVEVFCILAVGCTSDVGTDYN